MAVPDQKYSYRPNPRLSANQISEYLNATAPGRTRIIRDARFPKTSVTAQYDIARKGLVTFLNDDARGFRHLADTVDRLERRKQRPDATDWMKRDSQSSIEALDAFERTYNKIGLTALTCVAAPARQPILAKWPTRVSVHLDVTVQRERTGGRPDIGGAIFIFSKGEKATKARIDRCKTIAGLIMVHCQEFMSERGAIDPALCMAIDVFARTAYTPPGTFARKLGQIADASDEIAARWRTVKAPDDYDGPPYE